MPEMPQVPGVEHRFIDLPTGVRAHVAEAGPPDAPALLCLHGWPQHWLIWRHLIAELAGEARLICPDLRGVGWSGQPADGDFRKARMAEDAVALLDALGVERAHVAGHDWGGWVGWLLAIHHAERVRSLLALGIPHPWQPRDRALRSLPRFAYQLPIVAPVLGPRLMREGTFTYKVLRSAWRDRSTWDEEAAASYVAVQAEPERAAAAASYYRTFQLREAGPGLAGAFSGRRLEMPTRVLFGTRDPLGTDLVEDVERHGDDVVLELLEGCGHFVPEERPAAVAARARELLAAA